jgi:antitoxin (DNA-binding transcriptional repressor) of toxin-antitoxin stability system
VVKKVTLAKATASLAEFARALDGDVLDLTDSGRPVAALVPIQDMDMETLAVGTSPQFLDIIERSRHRHEQEGGISLDEMRNRLDLPAKSKSKLRNGQTKITRKVSWRNTSAK